MKTKLVILLSLVLFGCSSAKQEVAAPKTQPAEIAASTSTSWTLYADSSSLKTTAVKDFKVPVVGAMQAKSGEAKVEGDTITGQVVFDVNSWDSNLPLRNERVRMHFFETALAGHDQIKVSWKSLPKTVLDDAIAGMAKNIPVEFELEFVGQKKTQKAFVNISENENGRYVISSASPFTVTISQWPLAEPLKTMMKVCNHRDIKDEVEVEFSLVFEGVK